MKSSALARKAAAFGASTAVLAGLVAGLVASPAQAATAATASGATVAAGSKVQPKVSVSTPKASTRDYQGSCPVDVTFSATVKVKLKGKTTLAYRWLHGDGSKSKVKTVKVKGNGTKSVKVSEKATFKGDVKGWQALQVLGPRKVTSKKGYFSVSCLKLDAPKKHVRVSARAWASPSSYVGACTPGTKIDVNGLIKVSRPSWVRYRWVVNGRVVDYGKVKVWSSRKVGIDISARHSQRGSAYLEVLSPDHTTSNRAYYKVWCKDTTPPPAPAVKVSVTDLVTATNHDGCKVGAHANINLTGAASVQWTWSVNGQSVLKGQSSFGGSGSKNVTLPERVLTGAAKSGGKITLSVFGPKNSDSITQSYAACEEVKPSVEVSGAAVTAAKGDVCPAGTLSGSATVTAKGGFKGQAVWTYEGVHLAGVSIGDGANTVSFQGKAFNELTKDGVTELKIFSTDGKVLETVAAAFKAPCA
ncbi:hypothetical protein [Nonomuraea sp. LPB2021202275-12-8]|uniref:hypothetical protein n=1 Tax=Nonomuraea sp. LPB2021202275-12-8 TaxID=3120159 RepID=UPI00300DB63A